MGAGDCQVFILYFFFSQDPFQCGVAGGLGGGEGGELLGEGGFVGGAVKIQPQLVLDGIAQKAVAVGAADGCGGGKAFVRCHRGYS